jgi:hypothetical protein
MNEKKIILTSIQNSLDKGDFEKVQAACQIAVERFELSRKEKSLVKRGFLEVAENYTTKQHYLMALENYEHARSLAPFDVKTVRREILIFQKFTEKFLPELTCDDAMMVLSAVSILAEHYEKDRLRNLFSSPLNMGRNLSYKIIEIIPTLPKRVESPFTYRIVGLYRLIASSYYKQLTQTEREKEFGRIISRPLRKIAIKKGVMKPREDAKPRNTKKG